MAKRFTDTDKWKRPWFSDLPILAKMAWIYITDECDNCGIWHVNFRRMSFDLGATVLEAEFQEWFGDKVHRIDDDKYFIPSFVTFQYGELSENCRPHLPVIKRLKELNLEGYAKGIQTLKDKDKEQEKEKDKEKEEGGVGETNLVTIPSRLNTTHVDRTDLDLAVSEWKATLEHFKIVRGLAPGEDMQIARAIQRWGLDFVLMALQGARKETSGKNYNPANFVSLNRYLHPDKINRMINLGAGKPEASQEIDWSKVWAT